MKKLYPLSGLALAVSLVLAGCNSNNGNGVPAAGGGGGGGGPTLTTVTVTPSLGQIRNARIVLRNASTGSQIGSPRNLSGGSAIFTGVPVGIPVVAEVQPLPGATDITYFDEGVGADRQISGAALSNFRLRSALGNVTANANLGVTAFTEAAFRQLPAGNLTRAQIDSINTQVRTQLANAGLIPSGATFNITDAPSLVDAVGDYANLPGTVRGQYASLLAMYAAALRNLAGGNAPAIEFLNNLAEDLQDGDIDGSGETTNFAGDLFEAAFRQAAQQFRAQLPSALDTLADGITFSGGGASQGDFGSITVDGESHQATFASKVTVNGLTTYTWSDGEGSISLVVNNAGAPVSVSVFSPDGAAFKNCAANACAGITVNSNAKTVQFSNVSVPNVNVTGQAMSLNGTLKTDISSSVDGTFTLQPGATLTAAELAKLAGTIHGAGVLVTTTGGVPGAGSNVNCTSTISNTGQMSVSGGGFSITAQPNAQSVVTNTNVVVNGQTMNFRSVTLVEIGAGNVGTVTAVFDNTGKTYTVSGTRTSINLQNPMQSSTTLLTCSSMQ